ncbi:HAD superfamily hydrolase (TIGR01450 family) [Psychromicrobium silvestre]|uniref:HAD superfamily hydrolase (TIGR01450 family) n=1 Tax=Psychromicrobium silvestre TaxID=1645614 RepID=A0A7Y9LQP3_9MICC|nr:HAD-IIA family hydrolase [Psychromicrobium silvestre]NYE93835.1 HAD superfamily hydrolase (TIGR01450 family) [Psychromicrobium silvestre]
MTESLIEAHDALLSDLDGVVYAGPDAIPGAIESLQKLEKYGIALGYVTNNASRTPEQVAGHLRELGAPATTEQVFGSAQAGAALLAERVPAGAKVLVTGSAALVREVESQGLKVVSTAEESPEAVIQGFDPGLGWADLAEAAFAIQAGALWVATNTDLTLPLARGIAPGNGSLVAAVANATGASPVVAGKPEPTLFTLAASRLAADKPLVVGDRLDTDILGGNQADMPTVLVLTGIDTVQTALAARSVERPDYLIATLAGLYQPYPQIVQDEAGWHCGQATATVTEQRLSITVPSQDNGQNPDCELDGWRAGCAAWWAALPNTEQPVMPTIDWRHG